MAELVKRIHVVKTVQAVQLSRLRILETRTAVQEPISGRSTFCGS